MFFTKLFTIKISSILVLLGMLVGLCASISFQMFGDYVPCKLCTLQRYFLSSTCLLLGISIYLYSKNYLWKIFFWLAILSLLLACLAGGYQVLVQYNIAQEPGFCHTDSNINGKSVNELLEYIKTKRTGSCKDLGPTIFGFPISLYSCLGALSGIGYLITSYYLEIKKNLFSK